MVPKTEGGGVLAPGGVGMPQARTDPVAVMQ